MHKSFLNLDHKCKQWLSSIDRMSLADRCIPNNTGLSCYTQRVTMAWHYEQDCYIGVFQKVLKAIDPVIAEPVRYDQRLVVVNFYEPPPKDWSGPMFRKTEDQKWRTNDPSPKRLS